MGVGTIGEINTIANGMSIIFFGIALLRKKNKTEEEKRAAKSFLHFFVMTIIISFLVVVGMAVGVLVSQMNNMGNGFNGVKRDGTVKGDSVRYVQNTLQYVSIKELGLEEDGLEEGDRVVLFFDHVNDNIIGAVSGKEYQQNEYKSIWMLLGSMGAGVLILIFWGLAGRYTCGKEFSIFYPMYQKRQKDAAWCQDNRQKLYESIFTQSAGSGKLFFKYLIYSVLCLAFIVGVSVAGVLVVGEIYSLTPDIGLVQITRIWGILSVLFYIILMVLGALGFQQRILPLYSGRKSLERTKLIGRGPDGRFGYYSERNEWTVIQELKIRREDPSMVKVKCKYLNTATGRTFFAYNYIAKNDPVYPILFPTKEPSMKKKGHAAFYTILILLAVIIMIIMMVCNIRLLNNRDRNTVSFSAVPHEFNMNL
ncbi:MAG: hypothetical protein ACI4EX_11175 [Lachnospiraceae bacterium]